MTQKFPNHELIEIKVPNIDPNNLQKEAIKIVEQVIEGANFEYILLGRLIIIPPGFSPLAITVISLFHGICGHFPHIWFAVNEDIGYILSEKIWGMQSIRDAPREQKNR